MSKSMSFCPSTMATLSSSAWVALNSMRFMVFSLLNLSALKRMGKHAACRDDWMAGESGLRDKPCINPQNITTRSGNVRSCQIALK